MPLSMKTRHSHQNKVSLDSQPWKYSTTSTDLACQTTMEAELKIQSSRPWRRRTNHWSALSALLLRWQVINQTLFKSERWLRSWRNSQLLRRLTCHSKISHHQVSIPPVNSKLSKEVRQQSKTRLIWRHLWTNTLILWLVTSTLRITNSRWTEDSICCGSDWNLMTVSQSRQSKRESRIKLGSNHSFGWIMTSLKDSWSRTWVARL